MKIRKYLFLHGLLLLSSFCSVFSKLASNYPTFSLNFILFYGISLLLLGIYAILWQQILKIFPLTTAFFNKAVTVIWGMLLGNIIFNEVITWNMILGSMIVGIGILVVVSEHEN